MQVSVRFGDEIDLVFDHFEANDGVRIRTDDCSALGKTGGRTRGAALEAEVGGGVDRLHDHRAIFEADNQDRLMTLGSLSDAGGLSTTGRQGDDAGQ